MRRTVYFTCSHRRNAEEIWLSVCTPTPTQRPTSQNEIEKQEISGIVCERTREPTLYRISCRLKFLEPHINHFIVYTHTHTHTNDAEKVTKLLHGLPVAINKKKVLKNSSWISIWKAPMFSCVKQAERWTKVASTIACSKCYVHMSSSILYALSHIPHRRHGCRLHQRFTAFAPLPTAPHAKLLFVLSLSFSLPLSMSEHEGRMLIREIESMLRSLVGCSLTSNNNGTLGSSASAWYFAYCSYYLTAVELRWMFWQCATVRRAFDSVDGNHGQNANQCENVVCHGPDRTRSGNNQNVRASAIWTTNNTIFWRR